MSTTRSKPIAFFESDLPVVKGRQLGFAMTSKEPNHCVTCIVTCEDQWSIMQMEALEKMGEEVEGEIAYEETGNLKQRQRSAYDAACASLQHEQELHLQRMVYDHAEFQSALDKNDLARGIPGLGWLLGATDPTLFFHSEAQVDDEIYERDVAPYGITFEEITARMGPDEGPLYDSVERMKYVLQIMDKYHKLMTGVVGVEGKPPHREYMVGQIRVIARGRDA